MSKPSILTDDNHAFKPNPPHGSRSPCPALNTLANHGYIPRSGTGLTFFEVVQAIRRVYNISYPLAVLLSVVGFFTCGQLTFLRHYIPKEAGMELSWARKCINALLSVINSTFFLIPSWTLDLSALSHRGTGKIAHDASFVHLDGVSSTSPDPAMLRHLIAYASKTQNPQGESRCGLNMVDLVRFHTLRAHASGTKLDAIHKQIALGECALTWLVLRGKPPRPDKQGRIERVIPTERLEQWFGQERLPEGWWGEEGVRPSKTIGLKMARSMANHMGELAQMHS